MFIGRQNELKEIKEGIKTNRFESFLIYGRRRIGKTELINESLKDSNKLVISFECIKSSLSDNLVLFKNKVLETFGETYLDFNDFSGLFEYLFKKSIDNNMVLIIDEFSFLLDEDFSIESRLATIIDTYKNKTDLKLFISGSYVTLMEKMVQYSSHSYGRYTHIMYIRPFDYYDSSFFYNEYSNEDKIMMYSVFGGVPYFNSLIDTNKSAIDNIIDLVIKKDSILEHEINEMVLIETNKISNLNKVISLISRGINKYKDIFNILQNDGNSKPDYLLNKLIDMDIITKEFPINDENNKKKTSYVFKDNLLNFYYNYLFYTSYQEYRNNPQFYYNEFIKDDFITNYIPRKFESISKEYLLRANLSYLIKPIALKIGSYSFNDAKNKINREFDVVTLDTNGYISYECKYTNQPVNMSVINEEEQQTKNLNINFYKLGFISKNGFSDNVDKTKYNLIDLNDMFSDSLKGSL